MRSEAGTTIIHRATLITGGKGTDAGRAQSRSGAHGVRAARYALQWLLNRGDTMKNWDKGLLAGLAATVVLSVLMVLKSVVGLLPAVNAIEMLTQLGATHFGMPESAAVGWIAHFVIGVVLWGLVFAGTYETWPSSPPIKGAVFSFMVWLLMMSMFMPMAGAGFFATNIGPGAAIATLVLHLIFGVVLGGVFGRTAGHGTAAMSAAGG